MHVLLVSGTLFPKSVLVVQQRWCTIANQLESRNRKKNQTKIPRNTTASNFDTKTCTNTPTYTQETQQHCHWETAGCLAWIDNDCFETNFSQSTCLSLYLSFFLFIHSSIHPSTYLSICNQRVRDLCLNSPLRVSAIAAQFCLFPLRGSAVAR